MISLRKVCPSITRSNLIQATYAGMNHLSRLHLTPLLSDGKSCSEISFGVLKSFSSSSMPDLTCPETWYPHARRIERTIVLHLGPTNSGKTEAALKRLASCSSGIYCAPLRHMAWDIARRMNKSNIPCELVTDLENETTGGAAHKSVTMNMIDVATYFECAVIDDIQRLGCARKGFIYTHALLGIWAKEIHLCGESYCLPLIEKVLKDTGDRIEVHYYERLSPLVLLDVPLRIVKGDSLVTYSRDSVFHYKSVLLRSSCAMLYGSLPHEILTKQATRFSDFHHPHNVLVATHDVIQRGFNLDIGRVIFSSMTKPDGTQLSATDVQQIAGRAGRYGSRYPVGEVTCVDTKDLPILETALAASPILEKACLFPSLDMLKYSIPMSSLIGIFGLLEEFFLQKANVSDNYFVVDSREVLQLAALADKLPLSLADKYHLCTSPGIDMRDMLVSSLLSEYVDSYCRYGVHSLPAVLTLQRQAYLDDAKKPLSDRLEMLEYLNKLHEVYICLASLLKGKSSPDISSAYYTRDWLLKYFNMLMKF